MNAPDPGICVDSVSYTYGQRVALDNVSFDVETGCFCAVLGPNGAGESTLFVLLTRLSVPRQGRIRIAGFDLSDEPRKALARLGVVFQQPTLDLDLSVRRNLRYFAAPRTSGSRGPRVMPCIASFHMESDNLRLQYLRSSETPGWESQPISATAFSRGPDPLQTSPAQTAISSPFQATDAGCCLPRQDQTAR